MMTCRVVEFGEVVIVLVELGLVEQRYQAVLEVLNDASTVTDVAVRFGVFGFALVKRRVRDEADPRLLRSAQSAKGFLIPDDDPSIAILDKLE